MQETQNNPIFIEVSAEESATVNGASHRCGDSYGRRDVYYRSRYDRPYSRRYSYRRNRGYSGISATIGFEF